MSNLVCYSLWDLAYFNSLLVYCVRRFSRRGLYWKIRTLVYLSVGCRSIPPLASCLFCPWKRKSTRHLFFFLIDVLWINKCVSFSLCAGISQSYWMCWQTGGGDVCVASLFITLDALDAVALRLYLEANVLWE